MFRSLRLSCTILLASGATGCNAAPPPPPWTTSCPAASESVACGTSACAYPDVCCTGINVCRSEAGACGFGAPFNLDEPGWTGCTRAGECPATWVCCAETDKGGTDWECQPADVCVLDGGYPGSAAIPVCQADCDCPSGRCNAAVDDSGVRLCQ
jgi:hypothetical protein